MVQLQKRSKPRGAIRVQRKAPNTLSRWYLLAIGVVVGFLFMKILLLAHTSLTPASMDKEQKASTTLATGIPATSDLQQPVFDFNPGLTDNEVIDSEDRYILQVGSFSNPADANRVLSKISLLSLEANVEKIQIENRGEWYRVQLGPFTSTNQLRNTKETLVSHQIQPLVLQLK